MDIKKFLSNKMTFFKRSASKNKIISKIKNIEVFKNDSIINIHRIDNNNVGDFYCAPHLYFNNIKGQSLDIFDYKSNDLDVLNNFHNKIKDNALIIGGGGLLNRSSFEMQMKMFEHIAQKGKKTVLWGVGHNEKKHSSLNKVKSYNIDTGNFGLVGVRDYNMKEEYVPCASCLNPIFDFKVDITQEVGVIFHKKTVKNKHIISQFKEYPSTSNTTNLEEMISFIKKTETIITDSYHAMYWSMLLDKKVIAFPNSSKFYSFKYQPIFSNLDNFKTDLKKAHSYSGILEECREINMKFSEKVFNYLNL